MNTIQILIVAFVVLSFAYLILKIRDDIREAKNEGKKSDDVIGPPTSFVGTIEFSTAGKHIDIVDFTSMPTRAKNGRFLPKGKKDKRSAALKAMLQSDKELISNVQKEWFRRCFPEPNEDSTIEDAIRPIVFRCWWDKPQDDKGGPVDVSDQLFPKRGKDGKFCKKMPKARVDNFKGI